MAFGRLQKPIADQIVSKAIVVETGIGYNGTFAKYRVFESHAHMHKVWGAEGGYDPDGKFYDTVIPNYFDPSDFPLCTEKTDYYLYIGRLTKRKGINIAIEACKRLGAKLVIAGQGCVKAESIPGGQRISCADGETYEGNIEYVGCVGGVARARLYQRARATFVPTIYIEPFGGTNVESQFTGTPAITTDFGAFPETVEHGKTGFRCRTMNEFVHAAKNVHTLDPRYIHERAVAKYAMDNVRWQFETYFNQLQDLWGDGWYATHDKPDNHWLLGS